MRQFLLGGIVFSLVIFCPAAKAEKMVATTTKNKIKINLAVPFTSQAPLAKWSDDRFQAGCEEASVLMAMRFVRGQKSIAKNDAEKAIITLSEWQLKKYGSYYDTSIADTAVRLLAGFYGYKKYSIKNNITKQDIINELKADRIIIAPTDGRKLKNPFFTQPGPEQHMLVIKGYDEAQDQFITNDPGTRRGADYRYKTDILMGSLRDYPTGNHEKIKSIEKNIISISR
ncbi:MAG TPA: C39 family peptidase [bacterium]|nr:C39 family peptidase [bacterium]